MKININTEPLDHTIPGTTYVPIIPCPLPDTLPIPTDEPDDVMNPTVAICNKCGLRLKQVMHYVCPQVNCPCFARAIC